ncbi:IS110 family transposase [Marilutibacter spongiae]|uniref:IS110 family transposase n=2 Tax=Marilutibacter spongiae TaxID=2025720 RepID=A0A7W3Y7G9_9GAMM|nr:IS110 family transposase [Lysobacter spongiae]MBB1062189.1 IS110 family transposase [Lysobacter spongiae]
MHATTVAIDLAKEVFELAFADGQGRVIERKRLSRRAFARVLERRPPLRVLMEACGSAHYWGRRFERQGHAVRLIPARDVRPYVRGNKTDRHDVAGILEADRCGDIHPVPVKTPGQQGIQAQHRLREHLKRERTATINLLRGILREFGLAIPLGASRVPAAVRDALEDGDNELPMALRHSVADQVQRLAQLTADMTAIESRLAESASRDVAVQRYRSVPGIGLLTATALRASAGDLSRFRNGRQFAAWLGLTPREHSSGHKRRLGGLTKRGDVYLRTLLIHGARAVLQAARVKQRRGQALDPLRQWALAVQDTRGHNVAACALANKLARRLWAMEHHGHAFDPGHVSQRPAT